MVTKFSRIISVYRRSQWLCGRRHELSSLTQTLGSWVRIPLKAWMSVLYAFILPLCCRLRRADPPSKESYRLCIGLRNWKSGQGPTKGCRAIDRFQFISKRRRYLHRDVNREHIFLTFPMVGRQVSRLVGGWVGRQTDRQTSTTAFHIKGR
jgi:hypothetical protein